MGVNLGSAYGSIEIGTEGAQGAIAGLSSSLKRLGGALSLGVTAPLVGIGTVALKSAGEFEKSLNTIQVVSGATAAQMETLEQTALSLGASTVFSAGEAAEGMLELSKAGLSSAQVIGAIPGVLDLAAAGELSIAEAAEVAANTMNAFGLEAKDTSEIANMLAAAANASSVDVSDLSMAMKMSGAVFASNGQPVDDMVTALAILGNNAIKGSDAGTSLKTMMMRLAAPTDKANSAMRAIGLEVYNADGSMRDFSDVVADLSVITRGLTDEQRNAAFTTIFGADAIRAATVLSDNYTTSWDAMSDAVGEAGAAQAVANAKMKGLSGAIEYFKGSLESALIGGALPFLDAIGGMIRTVADLITRFTELPASTQRMVAIFGAAAAAAGPVLIALSAITGALGTLLSPVGLVVAAVAGLGVAWATNFGGIREKTMAAWAVIQPALTAFGEALYALGQYFIGVADGGDTWNDWLTHLPKSIQPVVLAIGEFMVTAIDTIKAAWAALPGVLVQIQTAFTTAWATIQPYLVEMWAWLATNIPAALTTLRSWFDTAWAAVSAAVTTAWATIQPYLTQLVAWFSTDMPTTLTSLQTTFTSAWTAIQSGVQQLAAFFAPAFERIKTAIMGVPEQFAGLQSKLEPLKAAFTALVTALRPVGELIGAIIVAAIDLLMNSVGALIEALAPLTGAALDALTNGLSAAATVVDGLVAAFRGLIAGDPKAVFDGLLLSMMGLGEFIQGTFAAALDALQIAIGAVGTAIVNSLADWGFPTAAAQVQEVIEKVMALVGWIGQLVSGEVVDIQLPEWLQSLLEWKWPEIEIGVPGWLSDLLDWAWPDIEIAVPGWMTDLLDWDWPRINISVPGWLSRLLDWDWPSIPSWMGGGGGNATGANYFEGGLTGINERGGESAVLPRGTKILTAPQTNAMLQAQAAGSITINMPVTVANSEMDFYMLSYRVADEIRRRSR